MKVDRYKTHDIEIVIDRMAIDTTEDTDKRLNESIKTAMYHGDDVMMIIEQESARSSFFQSKFNVSNFWNFLSKSRT